MAGYGWRLPSVEVWAFRMYTIARLSYVPVWTLVGEPMSDWWIRRIPLYENAQNDAQAHLAAKAALHKRR